MAILFVHGAGGADEDAAMVDELRRHLGVRISQPRLDESDMSYAAMAGQVRAALEPGVDVLVGHSFGGSTALRLATEADLGVRRLVLLAAPDWGPRGWDVADYALPPGAHPPEGLPVELHHCADDEVVPVEHVALLAERLPRASVRRHARGGHQFAGGTLASVAASLT